MVLHAAHAANVGYTSIAIRTVDTDVVALAVALQQRIPNAELWIEFVSGGKVRQAYTPITQLVGPTSSCLRVAHVQSRRRADVHTQAAIALKKLAHMLDDCI